MVDLGLVYDSSPVGLAPLVYTDAGTFTGADPDTGFDSDDELVFMARDAGDRSVASAAPIGTIEASSTELVITDPLAPGETGYVYLFEHDGSLDPSAGQSYVSYTFDLLSGSYLATYDLGNKTNPENSTVAASYYGIHFADRWIQDQLSVTAGAATSVDILDRDKAGVLPGYCGRTEDTFAQGGGAFIANKSGPWWTGITCTDPVRPECAGTADDLRGFKRIYYEALGLTVADAMALDQEARTPLVVTVQGFVPTPVPAAPIAPLALLLLGVGVTGLARHRT